MARAAFAALLLAGCGGDDDPRPATDRNDQGAMVVAALGDSITAGSPLWDPDPGVRTGIPAADETSQYEYWASEAEPSLEFVNCGVVGERTDEISARLGACAEGTDALIVQGGINDIAQGRPVADATDDLRAMVKRGLELGLDTYLADVLPWNNGHPDADGAIEHLNAAIREIGNEEGVEMVGFHNALEDPDEPGVMRPALTDDGDHPSVEGYRRLGAVVAEAVLDGTPTGGVEQDG